VLSAPNVQWFRLYNARVLRCRRGSGHAVAGSATSVTEQLAAQVESGGLNYLIGSFMFGNMPQPDVVASVRRFAADVMPALRAAEMAIA
jgi:hypothetical protein